MKSGPLEQLVQNLRAADIAAFPVFSSTEDQLTTARATMEQRDFSHVPVRNSRGTVVSILVRGAPDPIPFRRPTHEIRSGDPLAVAIARLPEAGFLLVTSDESGYEDGISGIINHADVVSPPVRLLLYCGTMQLERRVLKDITGTPWGEDGDLRKIWERAHAEHLKGGERRSCPEAYLHFSEIMAIGQHRTVLRISDLDRKRLCTARNFAAHAAIDAPADSLRPEVITAEVEQCVRLVDRLVGAPGQQSGS